MRQILLVVLLTFMLIPLSALLDGTFNPDPGIYQADDKHRENDPPMNLAATVFNYNDVLLEWQEPGAGNIIWNQLDTEGETYGKSAQDFEALYNTYDAEVAGDFVLTGDAVIEGVVLNFFYSILYTEPVSFNVGIFPDEAGSPGETALFSVITDPVTANDNNEFTVTFDPAITLTAGSYWLGYNMRLDYGDLEVQCYANQKISLVNETPAYWRNPGNGFGTGYTTWSQAVLSELNVPEDIAFAVLGQYNSRSLLGYDIYRNDLIINDVLNLDTTYEDLCLDTGSYEYYIKAVYDDGESEPSASVELDIILGAPLNFTATHMGNNVLCQWSPPEMNRNISGYRLYRNGDVIAEINNLFHIDQNVPSGIHEYHVAAVYGEYQSGPSNSVTIEQSGAGENDVNPRTVLSGNYPNPFNPITNISFSLEQSEQVKLEIFDIRGRKINTLINQEMTAGDHLISWNGCDDQGKEQLSGIYLYKMTTSRFTSTMKMILMK